MQFTNKKEVHKPADNTLYSRHTMIEQFAGSQRVIKIQLSNTNPQRGATERPTLHFCSHSGTEPLASCQQCCHSRFGKIRYGQFFTSEEHWKKKIWKCFIMEVSNKFTFTNIWRCYCKNKDNYNDDKLVEWNKIKIHGTTIIISWIWSC